MEKLATIERIHSIQTHPNEEVNALQVAKIKEWPVVVKKDLFKEGDLVVFIRIDSICPKENPYFAFLERQKYRIWNAKFKGAPSQGLVCPLSILGFSDRVEIAENTDVTEILGIKKYEKPLDATVCGDAKGGFPTHLISITDEDNLLNTPETLKEFLGEECYITIKADGSSMTVIYDADEVTGPEVRVCSRRWEQKEGTGFWKIADTHHLPEKLKELKAAVAIQAEACGGKIQGNPMGLNKPSFFVFNVKDISTGKWYGYWEISNFCKALDIPMVRLAREPFIFDETWTIETLQAIANLAEYTTDNGQIKKAEGVVLRPMKPKFSPTLGKSLSVKILNVDYK
jgi:RNA ligase (TIGR02306 family)